MRRVLQRFTQCFKFYVSTFFETDFLINCPFEVAISEMHILAYCYHWDRDTLWKMPRSERKLWVDMVQRQKKAESDAVNNENSTPKSDYMES